MFNKCWLEKKEKKEGRKEHRIIFYMNNCQCLLPDPTSLQHSTPCQWLCHMSPFGCPLGISYWIFAKLTLVFPFHSSFFQIYDSSMFSVSLHGTPTFFFLYFVTTIFSKRKALSPSLPVILVHSLNGSFHILLPLKNLALAFN